MEEFMILRLNYLIKYKSREIETLIKKGQLIQEIKSYANNAYSRYLLLLNNGISPDVAKKIVIVNYICKK